MSAFKRVEMIALKKKKERKLLKLRVKKKVRC